MGNKEYARWHRLASENLLDATMNKNQSLSERSQKLRSAKEYATRAFEEVGDEFTLILNSHISAAIESAGKLIERARLASRSES